MNLNELLNLPAAKLKRIIALKAQIEKLQSQLGSLVTGATTAPQKPVQKRRKMSAAARKKISQAAKARWAKVKATARAK